MTLSDSVYGSDDAVEQHDRLESDVGEEEARLPLGQRDTILPRENDFR